MESDLFPADEENLPAPERTRSGTPANPDSRFTENSRHQIASGLATNLSNTNQDSETRLFVDSTKTVITRNDSPDLPFDHSLNPYRGCEHGCIYCYARPSHAFLGHSPGLDFETKIYHKPETVRLLRRELGKPGYICQPLVIGTNTDAWQPVERRLRITRKVLELLLELKHPALVITKSALLERDLDLLTAMAKDNLVHATISLSTLDADLASRLEPQASPPHARLETLRKLSQAGIPASVMVAPVIPGLTDHELEKILGAAHDAGAKAASYTLLRLPHELNTVFERWLAWHAPEKASRVMAVLYDMRSGQTNDPRFENCMTGLGHFADLLAQRFALHQRRIGFPGLPALDASKFERAGAGAGASTSSNTLAQLNLF